MTEAIRTIDPQKNICYK